ncbi:dihydroorotate dehydrogenase [Desmospora profundinema]|uniref:Dihydroorotate dehydrogenase domain-containing protein n=1 Tax=Desmospora profundinema TaxID=1571184 RepID=A0ABU1IQU5_9BACL|nr:dihydroorotate dehydrogenase [Desmospora profundinema]MDR6226912.1 hypothetical protein [Desmospora profundinema]
MPDWSYRTLFQPVLFAMSDIRSRDWALRAMRGLSRMPLGKQLIQTMGHMTPAKEISQRIGGLDLASPVVITGELDPRRLGVEPLSLFGAGLLDLGIVTQEPIWGKIERDDDKKGLLLSHPWVNTGKSALLSSLEDLGPVSTPLMVRLGHHPSADEAGISDERINLIRELAPYCSFFVLDETDGRKWGQTEWKEHMTAVTDECRRLNKPLSVSVLPDSRLLEWEEDWSSEVDAIVFSDGIHTSEGYRIGDPDAKQRVLAAVHRWKNRYPDCPVFASAAVHEPADAMMCLKAGADLVMVNAGLVFSGPGLVKRINEAVIDDWFAGDEMNREENQSRTGEAAWICGMLMGVGLILIGAAAWWVASTHVILPYDEAITGMSRQEIHAVNNRLLAFMAHDRITLSGTMISLGILYIMLSLYGLRKGSHWSKRIMILSCVIGFASLFYFLGHGYLDPLHALLSAVLFPLFWLMIQFGLTSFQPDRSRNRYNTRSWQRSLWGQLSFVCLGAGFSVAGIVISVIGMTVVFVPEDLVFMDTSAHALGEVNDRLLPLIAHDRAGFGGTLLATGIVFLLLSLWGIREGERWVWWAFFLGGIPGFVGGIGVHIQVGYMDHFHLTPAYLAFLLYVAGLILTFPYLMNRSK